MAADTDVARECVWRSTSAAVEIRLNARAVLSPPLNDSEVLKGFRRMAPRTALACVSTCSAGLMPLPIGANRNPAFLRKRGLPGCDVGAALVSPSPHRLFPVVESPTSTLASDAGWIWAAAVYPSAPRYVVTSTAGNIFLDPTCRVFKAAASKAGERVAGSNGRVWACLVLRIRPWPMACCVRASVSTTCGQSQGNLSHTHQINNLPEAL